MLRTANTAAPASNRDTMKVPIIRHLLIHPIILHTYHSCNTLCPFFRKSVRFPSHKLHPPHSSSISDEIPVPPSDMGIYNISVLLHPLCSQNSPSFFGFRPYTWRCMKNLIILPLPIIQFLFSHIIYPILRGLFYFIFNICPLSTHQAIFPLFCRLKYIFLLPIMSSPKSLILQAFL